MKEANKEYWDAIGRIVELRKEILEEEEKLINLDEGDQELKMEYIQNGYGLVDDIYRMLYQRGHTRGEIDIDVHIYRKNAHQIIMRKGKNERIC